MKKYFKYLLVIVLTFLLISNVSAEEKTFNGMKIKAGNDLTIDQDINGSAIYAGQTISNKGSIEGIALFAGQTINIDGEIDYGFLAAETINVNGTINKDAFLAAATVNINEAAVIDRDIIIAAGEINVTGTLNRNVTLIGETINIENTTILGNITIYGDNIKIADTVTIEGELSYSSTNTTISDKATIGSTKVIEMAKVDRKTMLLNTLKSTLYSIIGILVVFIILHLIAPKMFNNLVEISKDKSKLGKSFIIGLGLLCVTPIVTILFMATEFGVPLGLLTLDLYIVLFYISTIFSGYILGYYIWNKFIKKEENPYLIGAIGIMLIKIIAIVPAIGGLISLLSIILGFGMTYNLIKSIER